MYHINSPVATACEAAPRAQERPLAEALKYQHDRLLGLHERLDRLQSRLGPLIIEQPSEVTSRPPSNEVAPKDPFYVHEVVRLHNFAIERAIQRLADMEAKLSL